MAIRFPEFNGGAIAWREFPSTAVLVFRITNSGDLRTQFPVIVDSNLPVLLRIKSDSIVSQVPITENAAVNAFRASINSIEIAGEVN